MSDLKPCFRELLIYVPSRVSLTHTQKSTSKAIVIFEILKYLHFSLKNHLEKCRQAASTSSTLNPDYDYLTFFTPQFLYSKTPSKLDII